MHAEQTKQTHCKQIRANAIEEQVEAMVELIAYLTENQTRQMETLIKITIKAMKEMMQLIKSEAKTPSNTNHSSKEEKQKKCAEKHKKYNEAPICKHCGKNHPLKKDDECWELEANKTSHPSTWKLSKST
jgi:hypothetical protein